MKQMNQQEMAYNELYELCESYRQELGEVRVALAEANMRNAKLNEEDQKRYEQQKRLQEQVEKRVSAYEEEAEALRAENERLKEQVKMWTSTAYCEKDRNESVKADTVRKMQERLKEFYPYEEELHKEIDQIAKELLEGAE